VESSERVVGCAGTIVETSIAPVFVKLFALLFGHPIPIQHVPRCAVFAPDQQNEDHARCVARTVEQAARLDDKCLR
jgi:hypothetical protein